MLEQASSSRVSFWSHWENRQRKIMLPIKDSKIGSEAWYSSVPSIHISSRCRGWHRSQGTNCIGHQLSGVLAQVLASGSRTLSADVCGCVLISRITDNQKKIKSVCMIQLHHVPAMELMQVSKVQTQFTAVLWRICHSGNPSVHF